MIERLDQVSPGSSSSVLFDKPTPMMAAAAVLCLFGTSTVATPSLRKATDITPRFLEEVVSTHLPHSSLSILEENRRQTRRERYRAAAALLREWRAEDDGYDDEIWPLLAEELKDARMRCRE